MAHASPPGFSATTGPSFYLFHQQSGKALDSDGTTLYFRPPNTDGFQYWQFEEVAPGRHRIRHRQSNKLLTNRDHVGIGLQEAADPSELRQQWDVTSLDDNRYLRITSVNTPSLVLDGNGDAVYLHRWNESSFQKWSRQEYVDTANWMGGIADRRPINQLSIPGTHDSGTATVGPDGAPRPRDCSWYDAICHARNAAEQVAWLAEQAAYTVAGGAWAQCQTMTIAQQLASGIRFLDIRCRHYRNNLLIHHGAFYCNLSFADVVRDCRDFLQAHPTETILLSVKEEGTSAENTDERTFAKMVLDVLQANAPAERLSFRDDYAPLGELRGKMQLLRRFNDKGATFPTTAAGQQPKGIDIGGIVDDGVTNTDKLRIQDVYSVMTPGGKVQKAEAQIQVLNESRAHPSDGKLTINFLSGFGIETPAAVALANNHAMYLGLPSGRQHLGVMPMDFPPSYLINTIIRSNFG